LASGHLTQPPCSRTRRLENCRDLTVWSPFMKWSRRYRH
jgi:hypothetical protein